MEPSGGNIKRDLNADPELDLRFLKDFQFRANQNFSRYYHASLTPSLKNSKLTVETSSASADTANKFKASHYEQTLVIVCLDKEMTTVTHTHTSIFPVSRKEVPKKRGVQQQYRYDTHKDSAEFDIPLNTTNILIAVKCKPLKDGICKNPAGCAFAVLEVMETAFVEDE